MKTVLIFLAAAAMSFGAEPERVIVVQGVSVEPVNKLLREGWTVKHQSAGVHAASGDARHHLTAIVVFTLTPPPSEVLAANRAKEEAARQEAFQKKREEWLKSRPPVERASNGGAK